MRKDLAELVLILDKSGSMSGLEKDTIGGFNSTMEKQKLLEGECRITTVLFNSTYELLHDRVDIQAISPITDKDYRVGGGTALLDAIGFAIQKIERVQNSVAEEYRAGKVLFVIITDGEENSSRSFTSDTIKLKIEQKKAENGWEFIFMGANIDAVETARRYGIPRNRAINIRADSEGIGLCFIEVCEASKRMRDFESPDLDNLFKKTKEKDLHEQEPMQTSSTQAQGMESKI
ncbi:MAG: VWA domain-containing protein [Clostridia bacterium]|nr:VWA domain-containing protein [Clostridia bacterium]